MKLFFGDFLELHDSSDEEEEWKPPGLSDSLPMVRRNYFTCFDIVKTSLFFECRMFVRANCA